MKSFLGQAWTIARKDLAMELRRRESLAPAGVLALLIMFVFQVTLDLQTPQVTAVAPGILWSALAFSGMLGISRTFLREQDEGCLDGLLLCPGDRGMIYVGKTLGSLLMNLITAMILLPLFFALYDLAFPVLLVPIVLLGAVGLCAVGTLCAAMTVHARAREMVLPLLFFPIVLPMLLAAAQFSAGLFQGRPWAEIAHWFHFVLGFDIILLTVCYLGFEYLVEE
jgi:heme exporter protein B